MIEEIKNNQRGFTMAEMLVSIFIIALISSIFLANYRSYGRSGDLNMAAQKLASDIREMQNHSLGLKDLNGNFSNHGWGIYIEDASSTYLLFLDGINGGSNDHVYDTNDKERYKAINLPKNYSLTTATANPAQNGGAGLRIVFEPPDPVGWICRRNNQCSGSTGADEAAITLTNGNGLSKTITVNKYGLIDILN